MANPTVGIRRRSTDTSATDDAVLEAAEALILAGRFATATVADLAEQAGVSRATVFSRLGGKVGVLEALSTRCAGGPEMRGIRAAFAVDDPVAALDAVVTAACQLWERQGHILLTLKAVAELEPGAWRIIAEQREDQRSSIDGLVRRLHEVAPIRGLTRAQATAGLHQITSVEAFMELRRNAGMSLASTRHTMTAMAHRFVGLVDPA